MAPTDQTSPPLLAPPDNPASWHGSLRRRLDLRIFALVLGFSVVLSLVTTSVWIWLAYRDQVTVIATNIDRIQSGFVAPLAQSLWEFDEEALAAEVKKIVSQPGIDFVQVITQTGKIFTAGRQLEHPLISRTIPISFNYLDRPVPVGTLVIVGDSRKVLAEIGRSIGPIYLFQLIMVGGVASFFFLLFNRMITQHLFDISRYLVKIGVSTEQPRLVLHRRRRNDELDLVADTVNAMREDLYAAQQALLESEERYRTMFEESQAVMLVIDPHDGSIVDANPAAAAYYGYPLDQLMTFTISMINTQTVQDIETDMQSAVAEEINSFRFRHRLASGEERDVQVFSSPISYKGGEYLYSIIQDITERVQAEHLIIKLNNALEQRVAERTAQLVAANHELEAFSYSVSHDLRAPVRHISAFAKMLAEASAPSFSAESQHFLQRILHSSALMGEMIEGLLQISRLNRTPLNLESVNLSGLAGEIAESCSAESTDRRIEWSIATDIVASGDVVLLRIVLQNLLGNAWKYSARKDPAQIEFGATELAGEKTYYIKDNGTGFDNAYADRMFTAFQRLHNSEEFAGIGIGLATVQRIVALHGGRVWADGETDVGSTFYFALGTDRASEPHL